MNLLQQLEATVRVHGHKPSLLVKRDGSYQAISYNQLWLRIERFALGLSRLPVGAGDKVAIISTNRPEWPVTDYAIMSLQAVVVPIYPTLPAAQIRYILQNADVRVLIVENKDQLAKVTRPWPDQLSFIICMDLDEADETDDVLLFEHVCVESDRPNDVQNHVQKGVPYDVPNIDEIRDDALATIVHTSGTSGQPKGVMLSHRNIVSNIEGSLTFLPVYPTDVALSYLPLSHIFERTVGQYAMLSRGATIAYAESIESIQQNLAEVHPTLLVTVPRLLEKVYGGLQQRIRRLPKPLPKLFQNTIASQRRRGFLFQLFNALVFRKLRKGLGGQLRAMVSGGAGLAEEITAFYTLAGLPVYEGYGMTETAPVIAVNPVGKARPGRVGLPIPGVRVRIADDGELLVRGPNVMLGYYHQPQATSETMSTDGWLRTGDIAEMEDGYLRIVERKKNILVLATGKNVAPWPIESALMMHPFIASAVLIGDGRKYVSALIVPDFAAMTPYLHAQQVTGDAVTRVAHPVVRQAIAAAAIESTEAFAPFERPKRAVLLPTDFTVDSGDLTPTLKVRNRIILNKYSAEIEAMYEGTAFLPLFGDGATPADEPMVTPTGRSVDGPPGEDVPDRPHQRLQSIAKHAGKGTTLVVLLALICIGSFEFHPPGRFDLVRTIHHIGHNTQRINQVNGKIVGTMQSVSKKSGATANIHSQLSSLDNGVAADKQTLTTLDQLSEDENTLSKNFLAVATTLNHSLGQIGAASSTQANALAQMDATAHQMDTQTEQLARVNSAIGSKLGTAKTKTDALAKEMP